MTDSESTSTYTSTPTNTSASASASTSASTSTLDFNSDEIHDEVELILNCSGEEIMELFATEPKYYLDIINGYKKTRDGRDIYLPDLCNIVVTRSDTEFRIRFKLTDNGSWYEVGFSGGEYTDEEVYKAFSKKVDYALSRPKGQHRAMLLDTLLPSVSSEPLPGSGSAADPEQGSMFSDPVMEKDKAKTETPFMVSQGDQTKLTKIDRFMGRTAPASPASAPASAPAPAPASASSAPSSASSGIRYEIKDSPVAAVSSSPLPSNPTQPSVDIPGEDADNDLVIRYDIKPTEALTRNSSTGVLSELDMLKTICPDDRKDAYTRMVSLLRSTDPFYETMIALLGRLTPGQRCLAIDFLQN